MDAVAVLAELLRATNTLGCRLAITSLAAISVVSPFPRLSFSPRTLSLSRLEF
jgi:hypothetical protein